MAVLRGSLKASAEASAGFAVPTPSLHAVAGLRDGGQDAARAGHLDAELEARVLGDGGGDAAYLAALWRHQLRTNRITPGVNAEKLVKLLLNLRTTDDPNLRASLIDRDTKLQALEADIARLEAETNDRVARLYRLTDAEKLLLGGPGA